MRCVTEAQSQEFGSRSSISVDSGPKGMTCTVAEWRRTADGVTWRLQCAGAFPVEQDGHYAFEIRAAFHWRSDLESRNLRPHDEFDRDGGGAAGRRVLEMTTLGEWTRSGFARGALAAAVVAVFACAPAGPSHADLLNRVINCIEAVEPADLYAEGSVFATEFAACGSQLTGGDPVMAAAVATMTALVASGEVPFDVDECDAAINGVIGQTLAKALVETGLAKKLGSDIETALEQVMNGATSLDQIPALAFLEEYLTCGCTIVTAPGEADKLAEKYLSHVDQCSGFAGSVLKTVIGWVEDFGKDLLSFGAASGDPNDPYVVCPYFYQHEGTPPSSGAPEAQCVDCGGGHPAFSFCSSIAHGIGLSPGVSGCQTCGCQPGYTPKYQGNTQWLVACACNPPNISAGDVTYAECLCPYGQVRQQGACAACPSGQHYTPAMILKNQQGYAYVAVEPKCTNCPLGMTQSGNNTSCIPICSPGTLFDPTVPSNCKACEPNTQAYYGAGTVFGACEPCPGGTSSPAGSTECKPLNCGFRGYWNSTSPHACLSCPNNQVYIGSNPSGAILSGGPVAQNVAECGCATNQKLVGDRCEAFLPGPPKVPSTATEPVTATPNHEFVRKDCVALGPMFIDDPHNPSACMQCPRGTAPNADRAACLPAPGLAPPPLKPEGAPKPLKFEAAPPPAKSEKEFQSPLKLPAPRDKPPASQ